MPHSVTRCDQCGQYDDHPKVHAYEGGGKTTIWLTGGTVGQSYVVANHITTSQGRQDQRTFTVYVEAR